MNYIIKDNKVYVAPGMYLINKRTGLPFTPEEFEKQKEKTI